MQLQPDKKQNVESNFVLNCIKDALFEKYINKSKCAFTKFLSKPAKFDRVNNGKKRNEGRGTKILLLDPPKIADIISIVGVDDQKQNRNKNEIFQKEIEFISYIYRFLDFHFLIDSEYKMYNLISGLLYFADYGEFNLDEWGEYEIGSSNQHYREYIEKRIDNDFLAAAHKYNRKGFMKSLK